MSVIMIGVIRSHCVSGNMVITKTDSGSSVDSRETLVPIISAAAGAALAVVLQESFPVMAGIAGALAGAAAGRAAGTEKITGAAGRGEEAQAPSSSPASAVDTRA